MTERWGAGDHILDYAVISPVGPRRSPCPTSTSPGLRSPRSSWTRSFSRAPWYRRSSCVSTPTPWMRGRSSPLSYASASTASSCWRTAGIGWRPGSVSAPERWRWISGRGARRGVAVQSRIQCQTRRPLHRRRQAARHRAVPQPSALRPLGEPGNCPAPGRRSQVGRRTPSEAPASAGGEAAANDDRKSAIVTAKNPHRRRYADVPDLTPEEYRRRGDAADALFRELVRQATGKRPPDA